MRRTDERDSASPSAERGPVEPVRARSASLWPALTASLALHALVLVGLLALPARLAGPARNERSLEVFLLPPPVVAPQVELTEARPEPADVESLPAPPSRPVPSTPRRPTETAPRTVARQLPAPPTRDAPVASPRPSVRPPDPEPPPAVVKTGAFAPIGRAASEPTRPDRTVQRLSEFDVPSADAPAVDRDARVVAGGLFGDAMAAPAFASSSGVPGGAAITIQFDATTTAPVATRTDSSVQRGGFDDDAPRRKPTRRELPAERFDTPVEIVSKQNPVYTDEARRLRIEGEVVLEVAFVADGELRVLRVVGSLGHGLDEAAVDAAKKIRFTPARRDGRPVDYTGTVRVVFRLA